MASPDARHPRLVAYSSHLFGTRAAPNCDLISPECNLARLSARALRLCADAGRANVRSSTCTARCKLAARHSTPCGELAHAYQEPLSQQVRKTSSLACSGCGSACTLSARLLGQLGMYQEATGSHSSGHGTRIYRPALGAQDRVFRGFGGFQCKSGANGKSAFHCSLSSLCDPPTCPVHGWHVCFTRSRPRTFDTGFGHRDFHTHI